MLFSAVSIVIPAFNEEQGLGAVLDGLRSSFPDAEILVVDDGSTDATATVASARGVRVIRHEQNRGYGASLKSGTRHATKEFVLFCDADGQHTPTDVGRLIAVAGQYDMVVGARGADSHQPLSRRPGKLVLRWFANLLAGIKIPDLNSGLRLFHRETLLRYLHLMPEGFSFSTTSTFAMLKSNRRVAWLPITVKRRVGTSTVRQLRHGPQTLMLLLRISVLFEPLKVFSAVAGILFGLAVCSLIADVLLFTNLADTTVLLSLSGLIIFMSGLLCDQVSALRRQQHESTPAYSLSSSPGSLSSTPGVPAGSINGSAARNFESGIAPER
jgi:glycosyltransferase involved in cell wall biosynthesis